MNEPFHCITCSDEGCEMTVLEWDRSTGLAVCDAGGGAREEVETALVGDVSPGDVLLVHAATALTRLQGGVR